MTLREKIVQEIRERGPIPFSRYMELCLYHPELGYYSRNAEQFGKAGDFYTSSDLHAVFGRLLARQLEEMWRMLGSPARIEILELGPGRGLFARDVLDWSEKKFPEFSSALHYSLSERSPALRNRLRDTLGQHMSAGRASLVAADGCLPETQAEPPAANVEVQLEEWSSAEIAAERRENAAHGASRGLETQREQAPEGRKNPRDNDTTGKGAGLKRFSYERVLAPEVPLIIFANEFFDALPVEVVSTQGELRIAEKDGRFVETWIPVAKEELDYLDCYGVHPEVGERVETPLIAQRRVSELASSIDRGLSIVIDYGYTRQEQLAGRHRGTVMAYRQHSVSPNPYEAPGEQDITAHVNFTALAAAAEKQGMQVQPLLTQSQFLMGIGRQNEFADAFEECHLPQERAKVALQLKHLITPAGMGESFHVLVASKGVEGVAGLRGLNFGTRLL